MAADPDSPDDERNAGDPAGADPTGAAAVGEPVASVADARELSRRRRGRRTYAETGRRHHLGAAPERMPLYGPDGSIVGTTRTSAHQLASMTPFQLDSLRTRVVAEMTAAATAEDFERAGELRDELTPLAAEIAARSAGG